MIGSMVLLLHWPCRSLLHWVFPINVQTVKAPYLTCREPICRFHVVTASRLRGFLQIRHPLPATVTSFMIPQHWQVYTCTSFTILHFLHGMCPQTWRSVSGPIQTRRPITLLQRQQMVCWRVTGCNLEISWFSGDFRWRGTIRDCGTCLMAFGSLVIRRGGILLIGALVDVGMGTRLETGLLIVTKQCKMEWWFLMQSDKHVWIDSVSGTKC